MSRAMFSLRCSLQCLALFSIAISLASCEASLTPKKPVADTSYNASASSQAPSFDVRTLEADLSDLIAHYEVPGLAVSILEEGHLVYQSGFGVRNIETGDPVTPDTRFRVGSVTKQFTAVMVGIS